MGAQYAAEPAETRDCFKMYMREVTRVSLLTREEEIDLVERVNREQDKDAAEKLVLANLRLVVKTAIEYSNFQANLLDLIQEGNVGLLRAVWKYDPGKGVRFGSYALFWIRAHMLKYLMDSWSIVKLGANNSDRKLFYNLKREKEKLERHGITASSEVLAGHFDVGISDIEGMEMRLSSGDVSLEAEFYDGTPSLMETLGNDENIEEMVAENELKEALQEKISEFRESLNERERFVLDCRVLAEDPLTLREVSEYFNISKERIRKTELRVSGKLTQTLRSSKIGMSSRSFLGL